MVLIEQFVGLDERPAHTSRHAMTVVWASIAGAKTVSFLAPRRVTVANRRVLSTRASQPRSVVPGVVAVASTPQPPNRIGVGMIKRNAGRFSTRTSASVFAADVESGSDPLTMKSPLDDKQVMRRVLPAVLVASLAAFSFGYHLGIVNPALEHLALDLGIANNVQLKGLVVSMVLVGATVGSLVAGKLADTFGRKKTLMAIAAPLALGSFLCSCAPNVQTMLVGRLLCGLGIGASSNLVPMYIAEISPEKTRGVLGSLNQLAICSGILLAVVAGLPLASDPTHWHAMFLYAVAPAAAQFFFMSVVPESPSWLRRRGMITEAQSAETALWGAPNAAHESAAADDKGEKDAALLELVSPTNRKQITIGTTLFFLQQMTGINAVIYFSTAMFHAAGVQNAVAASIAVCAINLCGTLISGQALDRMGRVPLLTLSFVGMGFSCLVIAAAMHSQATWPLAGPVAVAGTLAYMVCFGLGAGPIPGLLSSEIFSPRIRGAAMSACFVTHWVFNFVIGQTFLPVVQAVGGPAVFLGFAAMCLVSVAFVQTQVLETKGKTLDTIQKEMAALN